MEKIDQEIHDEYIKLKNNPDLIFSDINYNNKQKRQQIVIKLNYNENIDICEYAVKAIENGSNALYMNAFLGDIIFDLKLNNESLYKYFKTLNQYLQGNIFGSTLIIQLQKIINKQPDFSFDFFEYLLSKDEVFSYQLIVEIIINLDRFNVFEKHSRIIAIAKSNNEEISISGIIGLGRLSYSIDDNQDLLNATLSCLTSLRKQEHHWINGKIMRALGFLYHYNNNFLSLIIDMSKEDDPNIISEIVFFLNCEYKKIKDEEYFITLLFSLAKVDSNYLYIINEIDFLLQTMMDKEEYINLAFKFIISWIQESDCKPKNIASLKMLDITFYTMYQNTNIRQKFLFEFLNSDNIYAPELAVYIITANWTRRDQDINFATEALLDLKINDIIFICKRILGFFNLPEIINQLFYSILSIKKGDNEIVQILYNTFVEYIGYNYISTTINYLNGILSNKTEKIICHEIINSILTELKQIEKGRLEKERLKEFEPSRRDFYLLYKDEWMITQKSFKLAENNSKLLSLIPKTKTKYGTSYFYQLEKDITEIFPYKTIESSIELAYDSINDPVGFYYNKLLMQNIKRIEE